MGRRKIITVKKGLWARKPPELIEVALGFIRQGLSDKEVVGRLAEGGKQCSVSFVLLLRRKMGILRKKGAPKKPQELVDAASELIKQGLNNREVVRRLAKQGMSCSSMFILLLRRKMGLPVVPMKKGLGARKPPELIDAASGLIKQRLNDKEVVKRLKKLYPTTALSITFIAVLRHSMGLPPTGKRGPSLELRKVLERFRGLKKSELLQKATEAFKAKNDLMNSIYDAKSNNERDRLMLLLGKMSEVGLQLEALSLVLPKKDFFEVEKKLKLYREREPDGQ